MVKKIDILRDYMWQGDWRAALSLAAKFPRLGEHKCAITQGDAALKNPGFYRQIGKDPEQLKQAGVAALKARYGSN
jgi:hypothetical protein